MSFYDFVKERRSVRTFDGRDLYEEDKEKILNYARQIENPYGIEIEWSLLSVRDDELKVPVITGADTFIAGKMKKVPHGEEAFGFSFEQIVLYALSLGIGTCWIAGTMEREGFERKIGLKEDEVMPCVSPLGYPDDRMSLRESLMRKGIGADGRDAFEDLFFEESFDKPLILLKDDPLAYLLELVRWAPSAVNRQPWRVVMKDGYVHFYKKGKKKNGEWDVQKIDLGIALCHFACGLKEKGKDVHFVFEDPGIVTDFEYIASVQYAR